MKKKTKNKLLSVKLKGGVYSLSRIGDRAGDSGRMFRAIGPKGKQVGKDGLIKVGCAVQCGTYFARSYENQDWWMTTPVTKILSVKTISGDLPSIKVMIVKFKTKNSTYIAKGF